MGNHPNPHGRAEDQHGRQDQDQAQRQTLQEDRDAQLPDEGSDGGVDRQQNNKQETEQRR